MTGLARVAALPAFPRFGVVFATLTLVSLAVHAWLEEPMRRLLGGRGRDAASAFRRGDVAEL
jgi:hypothetical protein